MADSQKSICVNTPWWQKPIFIIVFILVLIIVATLTKNDTDKELSYYPQEEENSCWDPEVNAGWERLLAKYPNDIVVHTLYSLRIGLCFEVERNKLTIEEASKIFEGMRASLVRSMEKQNQFGNLNKKDRI